MTTATHEQASPRIERLPAVLERTALSRTSLYSLLERQRFPAPIKLSDRAIGFLTHEVDEWIRERAAARA